jgi:NADH-quinone oxidoreductase subunit J
VNIELVSFFVIASCAVASAILMILQRNPLMSAIYLIANFFCIALLYLMLHAQLLAVLQIVVYTGAIMVLVVFVIMLLNLGSEERLAEKLDFRKTLGVVLAMGFVMEMLYLFGFSSDAAVHDMIHSEATNLGTVESMGAALFSRFLLPFEVTSLLLLAAIVGAVVLAKKRPEPDR